MTNLTRRQREMRESLIEMYDCIGKLDALRFLVDLYPAYRQRLDDAVVAYNSISQYK